MFPAAFDYSAPSSLAEALSILKERGDDAKVMAGGQSLIPLLKLRFSQPALVVDIGRLPGLAEIKRDDGHVRIGALVRHVDVERSKELAKLLPLMVEAVHWIADPLVRNRGTVVGSVCHADPSGDWGSIMLALNAELVAQSSSGERVIPLDGFFQGPFTTSLRPDEVATAIRIPLPTGHAGGSYHKLERKVGDFATVAVSVQVELDGRKAKSAGIGLTSVGATNIKAKEAEKALIGHELSDNVIAEAARLAAAAAEPKDDIRGTAAYKKDMVRVFVQRGLKAALARAQEVKA
ncbi:MAG TPA: xanthine dehydrogenase family protein subunit M [Verrucomicrobiae bacterium]|jgi:carbon-monoxide dehydrogenase medium subunit|nr:xanthine dehydrogenase family protein subunit M [Verrucomicrobiae bacterium]